MKNFWRELSWAERHILDRWNFLDCGFNKLGGGVSALRQRPMNTSDAGGEPDADNRSKR